MLRMQTDTPIDLDISWYIKSAGGADQMPIGLSTSLFLKSACWMIMMDTQKMGDIDLRLDLNGVLRWS